MEKEIGKDDLIDHIDTHSPDEYIKGALRMTIEILEEIRRSSVPDYLLRPRIREAFSHIGQAFGIGTKYHRPFITREMREHLPCPFPEEESPLGG